MLLNFLENSSQASQIVPPHSEHPLLINISNNILCKRYIFDTLMNPKPKPL